MQIRVKTHYFIMNFEALYFCSCCLLIFNILVCSGPVETSPLLPRHRAYPRRRKSNANTLEICIFCTHGFFWVAFGLCCVFVKKSFQTLSFEPPLGTPYFRVMGGPKCSRYNEILTFLTFGHFWEELGRRRILTVFRPNKNTIFMKTWGEFDGNHNCFFIISKTTFFKTHQFQR